MAMQTMNTVINLNGSASLRWLYYSVLFEIHRQETKINVFILSICQIIFSVIFLNKLKNGVILVQFDSRQREHLCFNCFVCKST